MLEKSVTMIGLIFRRYAKNITNGALLLDEDADYHMLGSINFV